MVRLEFGTIVGDGAGDEIFLTETWEWERPLGGRGLVVRRPEGIGKKRRG